MTSHWYGQHKAFAWSIIIWFLFLGPDLKIGVPVAAAPDPDHVIGKSGPDLKRKAARRKALDIARNQGTENAMKESAADLKNAVGIQEIIPRKMSDQLEKEVQAIQVTLW